MTKSMKRLAGTLAVIAVPCLSACGGENLFESPVTGNEDPPVILELVTSESVTPNSILTVEVEGTSEAGVRQMDITLSRGVARDTTRTFDPPREDFDARTQFVMPARIDQNSVLVRVVLRDRLGVASEPAEAVVPVTDQPGSGS
ncbi:MAG TPA: hypothetical protein VK966_10665 [Longimicrobiales bacterium]|nr:hypothetical protein [Longimicrobiales bacterium]